MNAAGYSTAGERLRWSKIRDLLTPAEAALIYNALMEKARGDRKAAEDIQARANTGAEDAMVATLTAQAVLGDAIADVIL